MKRRCNENRRGYENIEYDPAWDSFNVFLSDMGERPENCTLDRIDPQKGYSKTNCRWADSKTQGKNKKNSIYISIGDDVRTVFEWADKSGVKPATIYARLARGWDGEKAVFGEVKERYLRK